MVGDKGEPEGEERPGLDERVLLDLDLVGSALLGAGPDEMNGAIQATAALLLISGLTLAWQPRRLLEAAG